MKIGLYLRLSREDENKGISESIENQRNFILDYLGEEKYYIVDEYIDDGISGTTFERKSFARMIEDCKSGKINTIVAKDLSRIGRNNAEITNYIDNIFPKMKIRLIAINDNFDGNNYEIGDIQFGIKNMFNEQYARDISKKVKAAIYTKKKQGLFLGGIPPYGYDKKTDDKYHLIINKEEANVVRRIFKMFANGYSLQRIAETLTNEKIPIPSIKKNLNRGLKSTAYGVWCTRTIDEMLNNPTYIGNMTQCRRKKLSYKSKVLKRNKKEDWIIVEKTHEPIIDIETFNLVQSLHRKNVGKNSNDILLKGFLICKECGHSIAINKNGNGKYYCQCNYYKKHSKRGLCTPHSCPYEMLETNILKELRKICKQCLKRSNLEAIAKNNNAKQKKIADLQKRIDIVNNSINSFNQKLDTAYNDKLNNIITTEQYKRTADNLIIEREKEKELLNSLQIEYNCLVLNKPLDEDYTNIINDYLEFKKPTRQLLASLIDKIEIDENKNVDIHLKVKSIY